jgi:hypothetical protein
MLPAHLRVLYLHGFASGPASRKAQFFAQRLAASGVSLEIPDLSENNFERLTVTRQLNVIEHITSSEPVVLIGSSLGGYLAALYAARHPEVDRLILLAPAFDFYRLWIDELGPERFDGWREQGTLLVFHYAQQCEAPIGFQLMEDARSYEPFPNFQQPALIFHGTRDPVVPVQYSAAFTAAHSNARLIQLESGHELTDVLDIIWENVKVFLLDTGSGLKC